MFKKFLLFALVMLPVVTFAQESKIAYVNYNDVFASMPDLKLAQDSMQKFVNEIQAQLKPLSDELQKKYSDYVAQRDSLDKSTRERREQEIAGLQDRAATFQQEAQQKQDSLQQVLVIPIHNKLQKAINDVGTENNYLYIVSSDALLFAKPSVTDATPLVKKKLGIQ